MIHKWIFDEAPKDFYGGLALLVIMHIAPIIIGIMMLAAMAILLPWQITALCITASPFVLFFYLMKRMAKS